MTEVDGLRARSVGCSTCLPFLDGEQVGVAAPARGRWSRSISPIICGALFLAVPKCPMCLATWLGVLGVAGAGASSLHGWLRVALAGAFAVALGVFAVNAWRRRDARPLAIAILGGIAAFISQAVELHGLFRSAAVILLAFAGIWNFRLGARIGPPSRDLWHRVLPRRA